MVDLAGGSPMNLRNRTRLRRLLPLRQHGGSHIHGTLASAARLVVEFFLAVFFLVFLLFNHGRDGSPQQIVRTRAPGNEQVPQPEPGERVVFGAHFERGLGLPASAFFWHFLDYFGLQLHHLPANAIVTLSCYVAFMEGYAGLWPDVDFWSRMLFIKAHTTDGHLRACSAASLYSRPSTPFPKIPTVDSVNKWQTTFFYVKNENPGFDWVNLPEFTPEPPTAKLNWGYNYRPADAEAEVNMLRKLLREYVADEQLCTTDLLCCYISR
ncbi:hypothetical protein QYE76_050946 [Lolium multiflorum]|uniref:Transposase (putative) gypsy type domain-containing protein n=1 Tax=Lolium multiflorum TaxID=4521 RepID=A0AAD8SQY6_LOLMU|nr:hypothetical protein QYE76_050946 [Lolium multiflorum]